MKTKTLSSINCAATRQTVKKNLNEGVVVSSFAALAARAEVVASLPDDLRAFAKELPVFYEFDIARHWLRDGVEPDSLGLFSGPSRTDPDDFECPEAPAITLFLRNLRDYCADEGLSFEEEVRVTYLHEFGHYLGLEEGDMAARGLLGGLTR